MKSKYSGFVSAGIFALIAGITAVYGFQSSEPQRPGKAIRASRALPQTNLPDEAVISEANKLRQELPALVALPAPEEDIVDLIAMGQPPEPAAAGLDPAADNGSQADRGHRLSLVFCSQDKNFCIIDGRFSAEGAQLPDGATVMKIEPHRVLLSKGAVSYWVYPNRDKLYSGQFAEEMKNRTRMEVR